MSANSPPLVQNSGKSFVNRVWTWLWHAFVVVNLAVAILSSLLILYDADTFWITPIMPDANELTACDQNYVCQALRGLLNLYCWAALLFSIFALHSFTKQPKYVRYLLRSEYCGSPTKRLLTNGVMRVAAVHSNSSFCSQSWPPNRLWYALFPFSHSPCVAVNPIFADHQSALPNNRFVLLEQLELPILALFFGTTS